MKIRNRLYISSGICILFVIILACAVFISSQKYAQKNRQQELAHNVHKAVSELDIITYEYLMHRERRMEQQWYLKFNSIAATIEIAKKEDRGINSAKLLQTDFVTLGNLFSKVTENSRNKQTLIQNGASPGKIETAALLEERLVGQLLITSQSMITATSRLSEKARSDTIEIHATANKVILILMLMLVVTVVATSLAFTRSISKPLNKLVKGAEIIGKGDLEYKVEPTSDDEIGDLARSFNLMSHNLKTSFNQIENKNQHLQQLLRERERAEEELQKYRERLEELVKKRTTELNVTNRQLQNEIGYRIHAQKQIKASLREKEVLLREIHHRVKNNLAVISSLLSMQANKVEDRHVNAALQESRNRVRAMALIHETLYQSENFATVDLEPYMNGLVGNLRTAFDGYTDRISFEVKAQNISVEANQAVPCGLIINELATNALKHAFSDGKKGIVQIKADHVKEKEIELTVSDNGIGFRKDLDWKQPQSLGLRLISLMVEQLHGTWEIKNNQGTETIIRWPLNT